MSKLPSFIPRGAYPKKSKREQNAERQREFRKRNPGYYGRLHAERRAAVKARVEARLAIEYAAERLAVQEALAARDKISAAESAAVIAQASMPVVVQERVVAQEPVYAVPTIAEPVKPTQAPERLAMPAPVEPTLPPQEAMLLLMLMTALARLQKSRAEAWE